MKIAQRQYTEGDEGRNQLRQDALDAWTNYQRTSLHITAEEAEEWLAKLEGGKKAATPKCHT